MSKYIAVVESVYSGFNVQLKCSVYTIKFFVILSRHGYNAPHSYADSCRA